MKHLPLHRETLAKLDGMSKQFGRPIPWRECFAEIAALDEAVRKTFEPAELDAIAILDEGIEVGGTRYYALTLNAEDWFEEWCRCWPDAPEMQVAGWLYAAAHSMQPEALLRTWNDKFQLAVKVWWWRARCGIKRGQIAPLQKLLMPENPWPTVVHDGDVEREGYAGDGWLTGTLGGVGGDPDYWRNKVPFLKALQKYRDAIFYREADKDVKNERWEQWRDLAAADEWRARKHLEAAWLALEGEDGPEPTNPPPPPEEAPKEEPRAKEGQAEEPPKEPTVQEIVIPTFDENRIKSLVMAKIAEAEAAKQKKRGA